MGGGLCWYVPVTSAYNCFCGACTEKLLSQPGVEATKEGPGGTQLCSAIAQQPITHITALPFTPDSAQLDPALAVVAALQEAAAYKG